MKSLTIALFLGFSILLGSTKAEATQWGVWTLIGYTNDASECAQLAAQAGYRKYLFGGPACWGTNLGR